MYAIVMVACKPPQDRDGWQDLRESFNPYYLVKFSVAGFLQAISQCAISFALGMGMSGALKGVLGKFYVPVGSILSAWILRKYYLCLEWLAIIIAFFASSTFGLMSSAGGN